MAAPLQQFRLHRRVPLAPAPCASNTITCIAAAINHPGLYELKGPDGHHSRFRHFADDGAARRQNVRAGWGTHLFMTSSWFPVECTVLADLCSARSSRGALSAAAPPPRGTSLAAGHPCRAR